MRLFSKPDSNIILDTPEEAAESNAHADVAGFVENIEANIAALEGIPVNERSTKQVRKLQTLRHRQGQSLEKLESLADKARR